MSRSAAVLIVAVALASVPDTASAKAVIPADSKLIDQVTFDPQAADTANNWHSKILEPNIDYTVVVSETITEPYAGTARRTYDALYCYGSAEQDTACGKASGTPRRKPGVAFQAGVTGRTTAYDGIDALAGNPGQVPMERDNAYSATYSFAVVPGAADDYRLHAHPIISDCPACSGSLRVQIYGPASAAPHGTITMAFLQRGLPKSHSEDLHRSATSGHGTLRLTEDVAPDGSGDRTAKFVPKDGITLLHTDDLVVGDDVGVIVGVVDGSYVFQPGKGEIVHLRVAVVTSSDPECPEGRRGYVNIFEPAAGRRASPAVVTNLCDDHKHVFKRFKSGGTVRVKIVRHRTPANARLF